MPPENGPRCSSTITGALAAAVPVRTITENRTANTDRSLCILFSLRSCGWPDPDESFRLVAVPQGAGEERELTGAAHLQRPDDPVGVRIDARDGLAGSVPDGSCSNGD